MTGVHFTKMEGLGNNYIYINMWEERVAESALPSLACAVADVSRGIGSDGLITIGPPTQSGIADARMRIFNADGSEGQNCGNGLRCVGKYLYERGIVQKTELTVETRAGIMRLALHVAGGGAAVECVTVDMGLPGLRRRDLPVHGGDADGTALADALELGDERYVFAGVSMGNPHAVIFVDDVASIDLARVGPLIECHPLFPERVNVEFVAVRNPEALDFRVWERGSGITQACGTGACAAVVAAALTDRLERGRQITVHLPGGDLEIVYAHDGHVYMTGTAAFVCEGEWLRPV